MGVLALVAASWVFGFVQGLRNRVVLFYDGKDAFVAFGGIAGCFLAVWWEPMWLFVAAMAIWTVRNAIHYNRGILVGSAASIFKITFGFAWLADVFAQAGVVTDSKRKNFDRFLGLAILAGLVWLLKRTINGEEVYRSRGWARP